MQQSSVLTKSEVFLSFHSRSDAVSASPVTGVLVFSQESDIMQPQVDAERNSLQTLDGQPAVKAKANSNPFIGVMLLNKTR